MYGTVNCSTEVQGNLTITSSNAHVFLLHAPLIAVSKENLKLRKAPMLPWESLVSPTLNYDYP